MVQPILEYTLNQFPKSLNRLSRDKGNPRKLSRNLGLTKTGIYPVFEGKSEAKLSFARWRAVRGLWVLLAVNLGGVISHLCLGVSLCKGLSLAVKGKEDSESPVGLHRR